MIFYGLIFDLLIFYGLIFGMPTYAKDWYNVTKKGNTLLRHKWWLKDNNNNTLSMTNREFSHCLSRAMVLMLRIVDVVLGMVLSLVIIPVKETVYCGYTIYILLFCFYNQFRPKNAANGILFGEASHPGPIMDNFPLPVNGIPSSDFMIQPCEDLTYPALSEQIRQRQLFIQEYGLSALVGLHLWFPEVDLVGTTASKPLGRRLANLSDARYATGTITKVTDEFVTINWNGSYNTALPLHHFLCGATYLSDRGDLYNKQLLKTNAIHFNRLFFSNDKVPTIDKYRGLLKFTKLKPIHTGQLTTLINLFADEPEVTGTFTVYMFLLNLALIRVPMKRNGQYPTTLDFKAVKYNCVEARDMVLNGDWLQLYADVESWHQHVVSNGLLRPNKTTTGPDKRLISKYLNHSSLHKATQQLKSFGRPAYADMDVVQAKHPDIDMEFDNGPDLDWDELERAYQASEHRLPETPTPAHLKDIISILREIDPLSSAGLDGTAPKLLKWAARRVTTTGGPHGQPRRNYIDQDTRNLGKLVYKVATGQMDHNAAAQLAAGRLVMLRKKDGGQRPVVVPHALRRVAGKFLMRRIKPKVISHFGAEQMASGSSNGTTKIPIVVQTLLEKYKNFVCFQLDAANAFNSIDRQSALRETMASFPSVTKYIFSMYGRQSPLLYVSRAKDVDTYIRSYQGTQQGDPLGMLIYTCGLRPSHRQAIEYLILQRRIWRMKYANDPRRRDEADDWCKPEGEREA